MTMTFVQTVIATELIKILFLITVGAIILHFRDYIKNALQAMKTFVSSAKKGITVLGSDDFQALPKNVEELGRKVEALDKRVEKVEYRVGPNGGGSILDGVNALKRTLKSIEESIISINAKDKEITDAIGILMWRADSDGKYTWASKALQELVGMSFEDGFKNNQWENLHFPEDLAEIRRRWNEALEIAREEHPEGEETKNAEVVYSIKTRYRNANTGVEIPVYIKATWLPDRSIIGVVTPK